MSLRRALLLTGATAVAAVLFAAQPNSLSQKDRLRIFDQVWETIRDKYYDQKFNGVNWAIERQKYRPLAEHAESDREFYAYLKLMVGDLRDAHTRVHTPDERKNRVRKASASAGIELFEVEGEVVITSVAASSEASRLGVRPGMVVGAIDGVDVRRIIDRLRSTSVASSSVRAEMVGLYRDLISGPPGSAVRLKVLDDVRGSFEVTLHLLTAEQPTHLEWKHLRGGTGYIRFDRWEAPVEDDFREALERLRGESGLIVDLRGNSGGSSRVMNSVASLFFNRPVSLGEYVTRTGKNTIVKSSLLKRRTWTGRVVILLDEASRSSSELFAAILQDHKTGVVAGRRSCGCVLGVSTVRELKGGGELTVSEIDVRSPAGRRLESQGVIPDREVPLRIRDLREGRDAALEAALEVLARQGG